MNRGYQIRRTARRVHRYGFQPMMFISPGDRLPETVGVSALRLAWRYRSELAPGYLALAMLGVGWWLHSAHPRWWPTLLAASLVTASTLALCGARVGLETVIERVYGATTILAVGGWMVVATAFGAFVSPMPQSLAVGGLVLSLPWWTHKRRRARVRVERKLAAWPEMASAVGLAGSQVMSVVIDLWGWRARLRLARGQTIADVTARMPQIESSLGTFRGAVRVYPTPDDLANRCELRVLDKDPHADAIPWPGPSVTSVTQPIDVGPFEDATRCRVLLLRRHALVGGTTSSGKSGGLNVVMGNLVACTDVVIWAIDLKKGMELKPWQSCLGRLATTPAQATALLSDAVAVLNARAELLAAIGLREWEPTADTPALVILIDEYAELTDDAPDAIRYADSIARLGRAVAVTMIAATQRPTQKAMGQGAVRSQMDVRICFRVRERKDVDLVLGQGMLNAGWHAHNLNAPGKFLVSAPEHGTPKRARAYLVTDQVVSETAVRYADIRPELDETSEQAIADASAVSDDGGFAVSPPDDHETPRAPEPTGRAANADDLWFVLCMAPDEGFDVGQLMRETGMTRPTLYRHLRHHADAGRVVQVSRGRWRARSTGEPSP